MIWVEAVAVLFGVLAVWLTIRQNIWCWPIGLVQVSLYILIFFQVKLYSDLILHVIYVVLQFYGWYHWLHAGRNHEPLPVTRTDWRAMFGWVAVTAVCTLAWGCVMSSWTDAAIPFGDAFTTVASLVAMWLMARKKLESWWVWIAVDVVAVGIYLVKGLYLTTGLYTVFLGLAIAGYLEWHRSMSPISQPRPA